MCLTARLGLECVMVVVEPLGCFSLFANIFHGGYLLHPLTKFTCTWGTLLSITFPIMAIQMHIYEHVSLSEMYRHRHIEIYAYIYIYIYVYIYVYQLFCFSYALLLVKVSAAADGAWVFKADFSFNGGKALQVDITLSMSLEL